jgi:tripartite-type tricarboxylate transporter receptor subunit TctC
MKTSPLLRRRALVLAAAASPALTLRPAAASTFPSRTVKLVVPYSVGIGPDVVARAVAAQLQRQWGQTVLVENKPGASGIVAFGEVRQTPPDGHTIFLADTATLVVNPLIHRSLPYDPQADLAPLTLLFQATFMLFTSVPGRFPTLQALLAAARAEPGRVTYATLGNGHPSQMAVEQMARAAGVRMLPVPFKDGGALFTAVAAGAVDFTAFSMNTVAGLVAAGKLRALAVGARQRVAAHPDVPTIAEAGGPPTEMHPWAALVTVTGTPGPLLEQLQRDLAVALASPEVRRMAATAGFEITPSTPQGLRDRAAADHAVYAPLVREGRVEQL